MCKLLKMKDKQFNSDWNFLHILSKYLLPLTREQIKFLKILDQKTWAKNFLLTGGTPLAKLFLGHRESDDLDFFLIPGRKFPEREIRELARELGVKVRVEDRVRHILPFSNEFKVKMVKNSLFKFDLSESFVLPGFSAVRVAGFKDILLQKIISLVDRADPKDYADVLFCLKKMRVSPQDLRDLVKKASDYAGAWDVELYFSATLRSRDWLKNFDKNRWKVSVDKKELIEFSEKLAESYEEAWKKELEQFQKEIKASRKSIPRGSNNLLKR